MAKTPKKEREEVKISEDVIHLLELLDFNSFIGKVVSPTKDVIVREVCDLVNVPWKDDGAYDKIYEGTRGGVKMELTSWSSASAPWKQRYEELTIRIIQWITSAKNDGIPLEYDALIGVIMQIDAKIQKEIIGQKQYKPQIKIEGVDTHASRLSKAKDLLEYWSTVDPKE
jgi:hypothetical protein